MTAPRSPAAATALFLLAATVLLIPWHPADIAYDLERSWALALHLAFVRGLAFGREMVFSFGPWGFLWRGYHPATYAISLAAWALFSFVFVDSLWRIARRETPRLGAALGVALAAFIVLFKGHETLLMTLPLLWFLTGREETRSARFVALTVATALAALGKFSLLLFLAPLAVLLAIDEIFRRRRLPLSTIFLTAALLGWWLAAGQRMADVASFLRRGAEIAGGFAEAMAVDPKWTVAPLVAFAAASAMLLVLIFVAGRARGRCWPLLDALAFANAAFFAFKTGFVRWDTGHAPLGWGALLLLMTAGGFLVRPALDQRWPRVVLLLPLMAILVAAGTILDSEDRTDDRFARSIRDVFAVASGGWRAHSLALRREYEEFIRRAEAKAADLPSSGSTDVYPVLVATVATGRGYAPRPVPQSYAAYPPGLARLNAEHLRSEPPARILFDVAPIDERVPSLDDSLSWPEILSRYDVVRAGDSFVLLARRERPRPWSLRPMGTRTVAVGESVPVPPLSALLWSEIRVEKTVLGRVVAFLFRTPLVRMEIRTVDGTTRSFRLVPGLAAEGFLLSPLVDDRYEFAALLEAPGDPAASRVTTIRVIAPGLFYENAVRVSFSILELGRRPPSAGR